MASNPEVKIVISAQDNASRAISGVSNSIQALAGSVIAQQAISTLTSQFDAAVEASNRMRNSLVGVTSVANAFGQDSEKTREAAKSLASDGLESVSEAATQLKNLLSSGFSLDQAIQIIDRFKDTAAFGRQSALGFGEAVSGATEGIKNGNSILSDNAGLTKNLSVMLEEAGFSAQDLSRASSNATIRQALFNGIMRESAPQLGDATRLSNEYSGAQSRLSTAVFNTQARLGDLLKLGLGPLTSGTANFIGTHQQAIVSFAGAAGAAIAFGATLLGLASVVRFVTLVMGGPLALVLTAISAIAGVITFGAFAKLQDQMLGTGQQFDASAGQIKNSAGGLDSAGKKAQDLAEKLKDIDENVVKANRDFAQSLADILKNHDNTISDLNKQATEEKNAFARAQEDKADSFKQSQDEMARRHEEQVRQIERDLAEENVKGRFADQRRIQDLQLRLAQENEDYDHSTSEKKTQYEKDTANAAEQHAKKLTELQTKLDTEKSFLQRHSADLQGIRAADALDEIQKLKQSHADQLRSFEDQRQKVVQSSQQAANGIANAYSGIPSQVNASAFSGLGDRLGKDMGRALKDAFLHSAADFFNNIGNAVGHWVLDNSGLDKLPQGWARPLMHSLGVPGFAGGVENFQGGLAYVHQGEVLVNMARGTSVIPARQVQAAVGQGGGGHTFNITNNNYNQVDVSGVTDEIMWGLRVA
ncbi:hypothetical protein QF038_001854 [Pseudarthrobacter sp. W1I19]|uniref:hypothetical protein n=1 Tax=Pseudarthrobacter sp. W1I19 TaxID=3042288 RepID=UPI0027867E7F|nr:hypothetical protein [Pseudarthrobacter sp. W1I19]MDQ0923346.1 hypothetical protein [Pseudarthrobacter sp. W1I19]